MGFKHIWISVFLVSLCLQASFSKRLVCYFGSWAVYNSGNDQFNVEDIDPFVCTHVIYSFVGLELDGTVKILDPWNDIGDEWHEGGFAKFLKLKDVNPDLKIMIAIGGWNEGSEKYSVVANDPRLRANLVNSATDLITQYQFDGFDIDWEYPTQRGGKPSDKQAFSELLKEFRARFNEKNYLLSAAVSASPDIIDQAYEVPALSANLDFINVMTYDIHGSWEDRTGHNAPLHSNPNDNEWYGSSVSVEKTINYWISQGSSPDKLNLGIPLYGNTYKLEDASDNGLGAPVSGVVGGDSYHSACLAFNNENWTLIWDDIAKAPYAYKGDLWKGYENPRSVTEKVNFGNSVGVGGAMVWSIESDDFANICGGGRYTLLNAIKTALGA